MLLQAGESRLRSAYAVMEGEAPQHARGPGVLYLTSLRLIFETPEPRGPVRGLVGGRSSRTAMDATLAQVRNAGVHRSRLGRERLVVELTVGRPVFDVLEPEAWVAAIAAAKHAFPIAGPHGSAVTVERPVVKLRCRYCGTLGNEIDGRCPSCGAPL